MTPQQTPTTNPGEFSRCEERSQMTGHGKGPSKRTDVGIEGSIKLALWKDDVLRAIDYYEIDIAVKNGLVYLNGHILGTISQSRIMNAIQGIPGILGIKNNLVLDDELTYEIATSLGTLEHTYNCKFFTVVSHGVVTLSGSVRNESMKLAAEKCAALNPNVRGVVNNVRILGVAPALEDGPFLQPAIGEIIYFLDGISGVVQQVIIDLDNRRVIAMTLLGRFTDQRQELKSLKNGEARPSERLIVISMNLVRYLTDVSGFLLINTGEKERYMDFEPASFTTPNLDWVPPYPYCSEDVLILIKQQDVENLVFEQLPQPAVVVGLKAQLLEQELAANDSLGG